MSDALRSQVLDILSEVSRENELLGLSFDGEVHLNLVRVLGTYTAEKHVDDEGRPALKLTAQPDGATVTLVIPW